MAQDHGFHRSNPIDAHDVDVREHRQWCRARARRVPDTPAKPLAVACTGGAEDHEDAKAVAQRGDDRGECSGSRADDDRIDVAGHRVRLGAILDLGLPVSDGYECTARSLPARTTARVDFGAGAWQPSLGEVRWIAAVMSAA